MKTYAEQGSAVARQVVKLMTALAKAQEDLKSLPREDRFLYRDEVYDLTGQLVWALVESERCEEALVFARKLPKNTHFGVRHLCEGTALEELGRFDEARVILEKGLSRHRESVPMLNCLGLCYSGLNRFNDALDCFDSARMLDPREPKILFNKAVALFNLSLYEDARDIVTKLLKKCPGDPMYNALAGHCYTYMGYPDDGAKSLKAALDCGDDDPMTYDTLYWAYRYMGLLNDAIAQAQEGIRKYPETYPNLYRDLAGGYLELAWVDDAREVVKKGLAVFPDDPDLKELQVALDEDPGDYGGDEATEKPEPIIVLIRDPRQRNKVKRIHSGSMVSCE